jgi:hypothetical protein
VAPVPGTTPGTEPDPQAEPEPEDDTEDVDPAETESARGGKRDAIAAASGGDKAASPVAGIVRRAVATAAGVRERWLSPLAKEMDKLIEAAQSSNVSDEQLRGFIEAARKSLPELFAQMPVEVLADHIENAMGQAAVKALQDRKG